MKTRSGSCKPILKPLALRVPPNLAATEEMDQITPKLTTLCSEMVKLAHGCDYKDCPKRRRNWSWGIKEHRSSTFKDFPQISLGGSLTSFWRLLTVTHSVYVLLVTSQRPGEQCIIDFDVILKLYVNLLLFDICLACAESCAVGVHFVLVLFI